MTDTDPAPLATLFDDRLTVVYTDGSSSGGWGPGGWAWAVDGGPEGSGGDLHTTNQRMEVTAALEAIKTLTGPLVVVSDSAYLVNCFLRRWHEGWRRRDWVTHGTGQPVANRDLWEELVPLALDRGVQFRWIKGHSGDRMNDHVDRLAGLARKALLSLDTT